ncbi:MAG TPA: cobalt-precorrin-6A reductase [Stellaceae bacterium]|nr:cobalt-precorrin-6A reductase [Stellaceae bacterium]
MSAERLLILGGTGEAAALVRAALARFGDGLAVTTSLAGRTRRPGPLPGEVRIGGFGGSEGLARYLCEHAIDRLIDATHPFASRISAEARIACALAQVPRLMLLRPPWHRHPLDRWVEVDGIPAAAAVVGRLARRVFLTVGHSEIAAFAAAPQVRFLIRLVEPPRAPLPLRFHEIILGRGPFSLAAERHLLQRHAIEALACKASGGAATEAKIIAARELSLPVVMVRRPPVEEGPRVESIDAALDWLAGPAPALATRRAR